MGHIAPEVRKQRGNRKWGWVVDPQDPSPVPSFFSKALSPEEQVFEYMSPHGTLYIQTITSSKRRDECMGRGDRSQSQDVSRSGSIWEAGDLCKDHSHYTREDPSFSLSTASDWLCLLEQSPKHF